MLPTCIRAYLRVRACGLITRAQVCYEEKKPNPIHVIRHIYNIIIIQVSIRKFDYHVRPSRLQLLCNRGGKRPSSRNDIPDSCYDIKETRY